MSTGIDERPLCACDLRDRNDNKGRHEYQNERQKLQRITSQDPPRLIDQCQYAADHNSDDRRTKKNGAIHERQPGSCPELS